MELRKYIAKLTRYKINIEYWYNHDLSSLLGFTIYEFMLNVVVINITKHI